MKLVHICTLCLTFTAASAFADVKVLSQAPTTPEAKTVKHLVDSALSYYQARGKSAFDVFDNHH